MSLQEQRAAIEGYAARNNLQIKKWFEERETAAKQGRPVFDRMMELLRTGKASGVVIHKIDRSARNLRDWSDLGEMMDGGIEVHFANEALDLNSRGGRLSADIQAVVATDYIRNLRDETKKGMRGRYKQGLFPLPAPIGYLDAGGGRPKSIDPIQGPLVKRMFELYASAQYGHFQLRDLMYELGLRTKRGQKVSKSTIAWVLGNPFYYGLVRLKATNELFEGKHKPLITRILFKAAREVSAQRLNKRAVKHDFIFRRSVRCATCGYNLTGEQIKGVVYYRCHTEKCPTNTIREDRLEGQVLMRLAPLAILDDERQHLDSVLKEMAEESLCQRDEVIQALQASVGLVQDRLSRVADAYLDGIVDREVLKEKQKALLMERREIEDRLATVQLRQNVTTEKLAEFIEFAAALAPVYRVAAPSYRQSLLRKVALRITVSEKQAAVILHKAYRLFASRNPFRSMSCDGESLSGAPTSNVVANRNLAACAIENTKLGSLVVDIDQYGCPPQASLRGETKKLLLEIGRELLIADAPDNLPDCIG